MWIDTHAHIYLKEFDADREQAFERCVQHDVRLVLMPNIDASSVQAMIDVEAAHPDMCMAMMGLHPCSVKADYRDELKVVERWLADRKFCAIGEIGTDLYWDKSFWKAQQDAFITQVEWAKQVGLPVVIHCRESMEETITLLEPLQDGSLTGVFHCFAGATEQARRIQDLGFYLGIGGVSTFKKGGLDLVLPEIGLDGVILETDSPYLAPVPYRGKRNEPGYIPVIGERVAELTGLTTAQVSRITTANAVKLFNTPWITA